MLTILLRRVALVMIFGFLAGALWLPALGQSDTKEPKEASVKPTVAEARERAKLMHKIYASTLDVMHTHFFRRDRAVLPARAMEDVFTDIERKTSIKADWISVNTKPMSVQHEPRTDFERRAAKAIAAGKGEYEAVENGVYRRAGAIPLGSGCVSCHTGFFSRAPQTNLFAGLVIAIPIEDSKAPAVSAR